MPDPKQILHTFPLALAMDNVSLDEVVQPAGQSPRVRSSRNTRLTKTPGMVSKAPGATLIASGLGSLCGGIVPIAGREDTAVFLGGRLISKRVVGSQLGFISALNDFSAQQDPYFPVTVTSAGQVPGGITNFNVATCYQPSTGYTYFARIEAEVSFTVKRIVVMAIDDAGKIVNTGSFALSSSNNSGASPNNFVGLTAHGTRVFLWYGSIASNDLNVTSIQFGSNLELQFTSAFLTPVITPNSLPTFQSVALAYDVDDPLICYVATRAAAAANSVTVMRLDMTSGSPTFAPVITQSVTIAMGGAWDNISLAYRANDAVLLAVSRTSGTSQFYELNRTSLATTWSQLGRLYQGVVACGFYYRYSTSFVVAAARRVFAVSRVPAASIAAGYGTWLEGFSTAGVLDINAGGYIQNMHICGQMVTHKVSDTEYYPFLATVNVYGNTGFYDPTNDNFVSEPVLEVYRAGDYANWKCVARLGTDLVLRYPGPNVTGNVTSGGANSVLISGDRMLVTYLAENVEEGAVARGFRPRYAWLNLGSKQPRYAHTAGGVAYIAGALPAVWDGAWMTEHSPARAPRIQVNGGSGTSPAWSGAPATYLFAAVVSWRDAEGRIHRSAPSNVDALTGTGVQPFVNVYMPYVYPCVSGTQTNERVLVTLYVSEPNGLVLYAQPSTIVALSNGMYTLDTLAQPVVDAFHPPLYTDGSATLELPAYCPNAARDVAFVSDRAWLIDAERSNRAWPSKPIVPGYAPEFNPDQYVDFPASAGELLRVVDWNGSPLFFSTTGLWSVAGEGPDALLNPPFFAAPAQVSDIACSQSASVVRTPAGILFVSGNRFVVFQGSPRIVFEIDPGAYGTVVGTAVFRDQQEVCFFMSTGYVWVYNWQVDGFTFWGPEVTGCTSITACAQVPATGHVLYFGDSGELWKMDPATVSTTAQISIVTGWMTFGGPQDRQNVANLLMHARRAGAHGVDMQIACDYDANTVDAKTRSAAQVLASVTDAVTSLRYDLYAEPKNQAARALQLTIAETGAAGEGFQGIHVTVELLKQPGKDLRAIRESARM